MNGGTGHGNMCKKLHSFLGNGRDIYTTGNRGVLWLVSMRHKRGIDIAFCRLFFLGITQNVN